MINIVTAILLIILAYFLGSIPFGLILTKYAGLGDIRKIGSGNIGATNVLRSGNKKMAAATLFLDIAKGALAVFLAKQLGGYWTVMFAAVAAVLGHIFPVWLKFKGGKGVATALAVYWVVYWPLGLFACIAWLIIFYISRISSFSSISAMLLSPVVAGFFAGVEAFAMSFIIGAIVVYRHKDNIIRLLKGQETSSKKSL